MPLDFTQAHAPPTLGKRRSKEEIKRALQKKYDIKAGLRNQGGFSDEIHSTFNSWDNRRREEYASIIARQDEQSRAQFGELPDGWSYMTTDEVQRLLDEREAGRSFYDRSIDKMPRVTFSYRRETMSWEITAQQKPYMGKALVTDEEFHDVKNAEDYVTYTVNHLIKQLADEVMRHPRP